MILDLTQFYKKRTIILCAFLVYGCTDPSTNPTNTQSQSSLPSLSKIDLNADLDSQELPLLTLHELLNASDVKEALSLAAANNDNLQLLKWQKTLLDAADEVNLLESEKSLLEGEQGLKYLAFQGMKFNYQAAFQKAFVNFEDVDAVYKAYPSFTDLHERSVRLVKQRDALIESVAKELNQQAFAGDANEEAKRQWQTFIKSQSEFN